MMDIKPKSAPIYFKSLTLENVKAFGEPQVLHLTDKNGAISRWTLILGENGVGKTTLLESLIWMSPVLESDPDKQENESQEAGNLIKPFIDDLFEENAEFENISRASEIATMKSIISAELSFAVKLGTQPKKENIASYKISFDTSAREHRFKNSLRRLETVEFDRVKIDGFSPPNIYAYNASRHMETKNLDNSSLIEPYANIFSQTGELFDAQERLLNLHHAALEEEKNEGEAKNAGVLLEKIKKLLVDILPQIENTNSITIKGSERLVLIKTPFGNIPLNSLSLGYKTMFALAVDLANRMFPFDSNHNDPFIKVPAIVIIDELDLHLHPKWQREVKGYFTRHFPLTQFICTAHSPIMAQASEDENLCVLHCDEDHAFIENRPTNTHGWRIDQLIASLFDIPVRNEKVENLKLERREILDNPVRGQIEETKLKEIDAELSTLPILEDPDQQRLLDQIWKMTSREK